MSATNTTLLSNDVEAYQHVKVGDNDIIISAQDVLHVGVGSDLGGDFKNGLFLFAESLVLSEQFAFKKGIVSTRVLGMSEDSAFSTAGAPGMDIIEPNMDSGKTSKTGGPGLPGGTLNLFLGEAAVSSLPMKLVAAGGNGGTGQTGLRGAAGGDGGPGGKGGDITFVARVMARDWLDQLREVTQLPKLEQKKQKVTDILATVPVDADKIPGWPGAIENMQDAIKASTEDGFMQALETAAMDLQGIDVQYKSACTAALDISGGNYGTYSEGQPNGHDGAPGKKGRKTIVLFGKPRDLLHRKFDPFFLIHPSQCARMLERIRLMYFTLDPLKDRSGVQDLKKLMLRLQARTQLFKDADDESGLVDYYNKNERRFGSVGAVDQLRNIHTQTSQYLKQLEKGQDFFGDLANHVPLGSFSFYEQLLDQMIAGFEVIEENYKAYFAALKDNKTTKEQIRTYRNHSDSIINHAETNLEMLKTRLQKTSMTIASYESVLPPLKQRLHDAINDVKEKITDNFNFNFDTLMNCLTCLAFAPESTFMWLVQISDFSSQTDTKVTDDTGLPVEKSYLISQVEAVESDLDSLIGGFKSLDNGGLQPEDPGAAKLVAEEKAFMKFMDKFKESFGSELETVKEAFDAYISRVQERNDKILTYNAEVQLAVNNFQTIKEAKERVSALNDKALEELRPDLPDMTSFVSRVYYTIRNQIMDTLNLTARAFRFWALSDRNLVSGSFGSKTPPKINHGVLVSAQETILNAFSQAVEEFGTNHSVFPSDPSKPGLMYEVPEHQLDPMKTSGQLIIRLPIVTPDTTRGDSIFAGMANIRINTVRVWVDGAKTTNNELRVRINQTGSETIVSTNGEEFKFQHDPVYKMFAYDMSDKRILEDANFGIEQNTGKTSGTYAAIGPFSDWQIQILANDNLDLDLSGVTNVTVEFHGTNYVFN